MPRLFLSWLRLPFRQTDQTSATTLELRSPPTHSSKLWSLHLPSSNRRSWVASTSVLGLLSIAGAFGVNLYLNPPTSSSTVSNSNSTPQTVESDAVNYQYGVVQIAVTATGGKITNIDIQNSSCSNGWEQAFPMLTQEAIAANGSNFSNVSGATFTSKAFKQALDSAISKLS